MSTTHPIKNKEELDTFRNYYFEKGNIRNYTLVIMGLNTALRISDILKLQWKDVYSEENGHCMKHLNIIEQKTGKQTSIALNASMTEALNIYHQSCADEKGFVSGKRYLFESTKNKSMPISRFQAFRIIKEAACQIGLTEHISCHSLRKTFGYYAWKQGTPPAMLMNIYNHSSYQITKRYLCIDQEDRDEIFMKINL